MSLIEANREYVNKMLTEVVGMKALLMDDETIGVVSTVFSQSECTAKEVYLFRTLAPRTEMVVDEKGFAVQQDVDDKQVLKSVGHLKAVCLLRPTADNVALVLKHLRDPCFVSYHLYFTNALPKSYLKQIAEGDVKERVQCVKEIFPDFYAVNDELLSLNIPHTRDLSAPLWNATQHNTFERLVSGISASLLSFRIRPLVRYHARSDISKKLATELCSRMREEFSDVRRPEGDPLLLVLDRRYDPVTPLLTQWSYQAMVHDLLGIVQHRVDLRPHRPPTEAEDTSLLTPEQRAAAAKKAKDDAEFDEVVLSPTHDAFFRERMFKNWGEVAMDVHELVTSYARQNKQNSTMASFEDIKDFIDKYPQFRQLQTNACKHMAVAVELNRKIDARRLLEVTEMEQELACVEAHQVACEKLIPFLEDPRFTATDKLKVAMIYALRYEARPKHESQLPRIKELLLATENGEHNVALLEALMEYAGASQRKNDLFNQQNVITKKAAKIFELFSTDFKSAESVFTSHKPYLDETIRAINARSLNVTEFPYAEGDAKKAYHHRWIMVFIVGGATFEEAKLVHDLNAANLGQRILLGGSSMINSQQFLDDLAGTIQQAQVADLL